MPLQPDPAPPLSVAEDLSAVPPGSFPGNPAGRDYWTARPGGHSVPVPIPSSHQSTPSLGSVSLEWSEPTPSVPGQSRLWPTREGGSGRWRSGLQSWLSQVVRHKSRLRHLCKNGLALSGPHGLKKKNKTSEKTFELTFISQRFHLKVWISRQMGMFGHIAVSWQQLARLLTPGQLTRLLSAFGPLGTWVNFSGLLQQITVHAWLRAAETCSFTVLEARGLKSRGRQGLTSSKNSGRESFLPLPSSHGRRPSRALLGLQCVILSASITARPSSPGVPMCLLIKVLITGVGSP
uniref:Uncharacterized protein n=1 Tax=Pipistrellus kuhlii TaxID=59472 RepID=A0A7J7UTW5_PIPKU|nr:hypothetical protein mPipKuh1_008728 [Pipistrellus kuhlii]